MLILVAPWVDPYRELGNGFFDFTIDNDLERRIGSIELFVSNDDDPDILESVRVLESALPSAKIHRYEHQGHFTRESMGTEEFPDLIDAVF